MESIPKTIRDAERQFYKMPCVIEQARFGRMIGNYPWHIDSYHDKMNEYTIAIFRVYPKGQNPMSKLRAEKEKGRQFSRDIDRKFFETVTGQPILSDTWKHTDTPPLKGIKLVTEIY